MLAAIGNVIVWIACLFVLALVVAGIIGGVLEERALRARRLAEEQAQEREIEAYRQAADHLRATWAERTKGGTVISLKQDRRLHLFGKRSKPVGEYAAQRVFRRDVYDWCRSNLNGSYGIIPVLHEDEDSTRIWFADANDAMYFKMRWY